MHTAKYSIKPKNDLKPMTTSGYTLTGEIRNFLQVT